MSGRTRRLSTAAAMAAAPLMAVAPGASATWKGEIAAWTDGGGKHACCLLRALHAGVDTTKADG